MVSNKKDSQGFENSYNSYEQLEKPIREIFHFHHLPKLYFGFKMFNKLEQHNTDAKCVLIQ